MSEACNCETACARVFLSRPTQGECGVMIAWHIDKGSFNDVKLDGLNVASAVYSPGHMAEVKWNASHVGKVLGVANAGPVELSALLQMTATRSSDRWLAHSPPSEQGRIAFLLARDGPESARRWVERTL